MRRFGAVVLAAALALPGCQKSDSGKGAGSGSGSAVATGSGSAAGMGRPKTEQIPPPMDLKTPPADATKTASGLVYKVTTPNPTGAAPKKNDTVMINYTGWRQSSGETFFSNKARGQPMPLNLANTAPGFTEALQLLKKGETAVLWVPPSIGYKGPPQGNAETLVYQVEVIDIVPAPAIPDDVAKPPADAQTLKSGLKYVVVRPGTGTEKARYFDNVTFHYSAWDDNGRMYDSTEMRKRPATAPPFRQTPPMQEVLTNMVAGERLRFWIDGAKMVPAGRPSAGIPTGQVCYEVEVLEIKKGVEPPAVPTDVAKAPADAKKTAKGVSYKVLSTGKGGPKPAATDTVKVNYTGWTTDGRMFDSSVTRGEPAEFPLQGVIAGWTDGLQVMSVGDKVRFWIPEELAYKGAPGKPQGMLVFDIELLEIKPPGSSPHAGPHHGPMPLPPGAQTMHGTGVVGSPSTLHPSGAAPMTPPPAPAPK